ncbi:AAA family ATPase [Streptomyces sp. NPDC005423]|uniref:AAA family ATPase n=1 Tax=Streptomyces sp. NPDC005423 TaxID=3155343 RepID=UPI0033B7CDE0
MTEAGRASVAGVLETVLATCAVGRSRAVLIEGAAGCGKSHLLDVVAERAAAAGALVLSAVATEEERRVPLGVLRQLVSSAPVFALPRSGAGEEAAGAAAVRTFCAELCDLALDGPVVLCLDDVQHADAQSLEHLRYLVRHARPAPVLVVATVSSHPPAGAGPFVTELTGQPHARLIRLGLLSVQETARALGSRPGRTAAELHRVSGGNPFLLRALLEEDERGARALLSPVPASDGPFAGAVLTCVRRSGPEVLAAARAVAVLAPRATQSLVAAVLGSGGGGGGSVAAALGALRACGLLEGLRFRHPSVRDAVLADASPRLRADLHRRAALVLRAAGAPAEVVAGHLLAPAAEGVRRPVRGEDLALVGEVAEELLAGHRAEQAERLLELAYGVCPEGLGRDALALRLAQLAARRDPGAAEVRLSALAAGVRPGGAGERHGRRLASLLLAHGRVAEAAQLLRAVRGPGAADTFEEFTAATAAVAGGSGGGGAGGGVNLFDELLDTPPAACEAVLRSTPLTDASLGALVQAVRTLVYSGRPGRALAFTGGLLEEADRCRAPGWRAVFATLHAETLLRLGDVRGAHAQAAAVLEALPPGGGGTFRYAPTAVLIQACGALGRYTEAAGHTQYPVTRRLLSSLHGVQYLRARGLHQLAAGQPHTALADFRRIGRTLRSWEADRPACLPWRTDAAQALLGLGRAEQARRLVEEQLALPDARRPLVRGVSLRLLAESGARSRRTGLLRQAVEELRRAGARLETARALADLGRALYEEGSAAQGGATVRAAWNMARRLEAAALCEELLPDSLSPLPVPGDPGDPDAQPLSGSEQRVAALAVQGLSNRQIAARLFLTVSTVEQHLTRVYRKLRVRGREELPARLTAGTPTAG